MKCEFCKFAPPVNADGYQDECSLFDIYGIVWKDGKEGCTVAYQTLAKNEREHDRAMWEYATDWGLEHDFENHGWDMDLTVKHCLHMIGHGRSKEYYRHGKHYMKAYRNYWYGKMRDDFEYMCRGTFGYMARTLPSDDGYVYYSLTEEGLKWLGRKTNMIIKECD